MNILSLDTSTTVLSIALKSDDSYEERLVDGNFSHSEDLLHEIKELLKRDNLSLKDIELIVVAKGPGSFTGLRIGMATAKGISLALAIPVVSIPTLDAIAHSVSIYPGPVLSAIDAKKKRFYFSLKKDGVSIVSDRDGHPEELVAEIKKLAEPVLATGPDALLIADKINSIDPALPIIVDPESPRNISRSLIELGLEKFRKDGADDIGEGPVYIRRSDAEVALEKKIEEGIR